MPTVPMTRFRLLGPLAPLSLDGEWSLASLLPAAATDPAGLEAARPDWISCAGPMTVAAALRAAGRWNLETNRDFDAEDWWFRCRFKGSLARGECRIRFEGLATVADIWLNGVPLLHSDSMFLAHESSAVRFRPGPNELLFRFHALGPLLNQKRPRPRWKTRLVANQQLRWHRTALVGRIQEWCPAVAPVGPWRNVVLMPESTARLTDVRLAARANGSDGQVAVALRIQHGPDAPPRAAALSVGGHSAPLALRTVEGGTALAGEVHLGGVRRWWPHSHGAQPRYPVELTIDAGGEPLVYALGKIGFRTVEVERDADGEGFGLRINGVDVFSRGACWTPLDLARLGAEPADYRSALEQARRAGMNMIRVGGTMVYECDAFYETCDELGILVWHDLMFANMDYPMDDLAFAQLVEDEARQFLSRMQGRPSLAVLCGSSELQQQAAMLGLPAERWSDTRHIAILARCCAELAGDVPWVASSPSGGAMPFQSDRGVAHYFGVGGYRRPLEDARRAGVRFASECLAFSNVPEPDVVDRLRRAASVGPGLDRWRAGVPRDPGATWDFEDVRNHYVEQIFASDPSGPWERDGDRYLALGRVTTGEVMERTAGEWRRPGSSCRGALIWFLRDLIPGAGWGVVDAGGRPKAAYWYLRRAWAQVSLIASDEGLNGLHLHALNDRAEPLRGELRVTLYRCGTVPVASASVPIGVPGRGATTIRADSLFDGFLDLTYAYKFGPPGHDTVAASLTSADGAHLATAFHWPVGMPSTRSADLELTATATPVDCGYEVTLAANQVAVATALRADGFTPDDNYLHLEPGRPRIILMRRNGSEETRFSGTVEALNGAAIAPIVVAP